MSGKTIWCIAAAWLVLFTVAGAAEPGPVYLSSFFREPDGKEGLHLAVSRDGYRWDEIGPADHTWLKPTLGSRCMRDPCLRQGPDGTFHLVWTTGWADKGFGYANSKDLIHWSEQLWVPVNEKIAGAKNTWAPETFYDAAKQQWLIVWLTTIEGRFPETATGGDNHRLYYATTKDFKTFSPTRLFCDPGFNCIDGTLLAAGRKVFLILKHEPKARLRICTADSPEGPWRPAANLLPGPGKRAEGPSALKVGDEYLVYFDLFTDNTYGAARSKDLRNWEDATDKVHFPAGFRHATMIEVAPTVIERLRTK